MTRLGFEISVNDDILAHITLLRMIAENKYLSIFKNSNPFLSIAVFVCLICWSTASFSNCKNRLFTTRVDTTIISKDSFAPLYRYMASNIRFPKTARENGTTGTVIISFRLTDQGTVDSVVALKKITRGYDCLTEVTRVITGFKDANKQLKGGTYKMAVTFKLQGVDTPEPIDPLLKKEPNFLNEIVVSAYSTIH
jgi:hypothetical protein